MKHFFGENKLKFAGRIQLGERIDELLSQGRFKEAVFLFRQEEARLINLRKGVGKERNVTSSTRRLSDLSATEERINAKLRLIGNVLRGRASLLKKASMPQKPKKFFRKPLLK
jgi:hypothetical protein